MTVAGTAPAPPTVQKNESTGTAGKSKGKPEELGQDQIQRLATGVTVDTEVEAPHNRPIKPSLLESQAGLLKIVSLPPSYPHAPAPRTLVLLTNLKCLFQKQLPKMPREYITRLVFDKNSHCMAIVKRGLKVVGGICYRVFEQRGFAEIVFFATASVDQVRGYGSMLMNHFKMHIKSTYPGMMHFLTYADNYAVGYFKKQGFSKEITLDRAVWAGYIKDYEGGTIMQCTMLRKVNYLETRDILAKQREAILTKIREISKSHIVYPPLPQFLRAKKGEEVVVDWQTVPGLRESGWTPSMIETPRPASRNPQHAAMERWLSELQGHSAAWPFLQPVNGEEVTDYYDVVKNPMDFSTMEHKLDHNVYTEIDSFVSDANLVFDNCILYNPEGSIYAKSALKLGKFLKEMVEEDMKNIANA
ncbi:Bromodomain-containing protein [Ramaria rubella]|nr:Bromodomain-containing protein [Ramaria rubella]